MMFDSSTTDISMLYDDTPSQHNNNQYGYGDIYQEPETVHHNDSIYDDILGGVSSQSFNQPTHQQEKVVKEIVKEEVVVTSKFNKSSNEVTKELLLNNITVKNRDDELDLTKVLVIINKTIRNGYNNLLIAGKLKEYLTSDQFSISDTKDMVKAIKGGLTKKKVMNTLPKEVNELLTDVLYETLSDIYDIVGDFLKNFNSLKNIGCSEDIDDIDKNAINKFINRAVSMLDSISEDVDGTTYVMKKVGIVFVNEQAEHYLMEELGYVRDPLEIPEHSNLNRLVRGLHSYEFDTLFVILDKDIYKVKREIVNKIII